MADYEFHPGEIVTVVNRSSQPVTWRFNGRQFRLEPKERRPLNLVFALAGIRQNPVMGTYDPAFEHQHLALIGIVEMNDRWPTTPQEQSSAIEAMDRSKLPEDRQAARVEKVGWSPEERLMASRADLPTDAGFAGALPDK